MNAHPDDVALMERIACTPREGSLATPHGEKPTLLRRTFLIDDPDAMEVDHEASR